MTHLDHTRPDPSTSASTSTSPQQEHQPLPPTMAPRPLPADAFTDEETYRLTRLPVDHASTLVPDA